MAAKNLPPAFNAVCLHGLTLHNDTD